LDSEDRATETVNNRDAVFMMIFTS